MIGTDDALYSTCNRAARTPTRVYTAHFMCAKAHSNLDPGLMADDQNSYTREDFGPVRGVILP